MRKKILTVKKFKIINKKTGLELHEHIKENPIHYINIRGNVITSSLYDCNVYTYINTQADEIGILIKNNMGIQQPRFYILVRNHWEIKDV